jgi:hypothetical protein
MYRATNLNRLETWLGKDKVEHLSKSMNGWYGPEIHVFGVPGNVRVTPDGDFVGECREGYYYTFMDRARDVVQRLGRASRIASGDHRTRLQVGFASLSDLINAATVNQYRNEMTFQKLGVTGVANATNTLWYEGNLPQAGGNASAAAAGRACTSSTTGAMNSLVNGTTYAASLHLNLVSANAFASVISNTLLLYDRLFDVLKTMSSSATEAVSGVPTRYQSQTSTDPDYIGGNFLFVECGAVLSGTSHNWTTCLYNDQGGSSSTLPSLTGNSANIAKRIDHPVNQWFAPLEAGDVGIKALTQMQCSSNALTGTINFVIGHPLAFMPFPIALQFQAFDYINTMFSMPRIFDSACLAFLEVTKPTTTACTYAGNLIALAG